MISFKYFFNRLKDVKLQDYLAVFPMIAGLILRPLFKNKYSKAWLICEEPAEARDNGYHLYKYMCEKQSQQKCYYAIKKDSVDYPKVKDLAGDDNIITYGSVQHWLAYFLCEYNISSQKGGKPDAALCAFFELNGWFKPNNVFLQHGITKDKAKWLYSNVCCFKYFITAAIPEYNFINKYYGYGDNTVKLTGFPRYDNLFNFTVNKKQILIMPTWRYWFNLSSKQSDDTDNDFYSSEYLAKWSSLLKNKKLLQYLRENDIKIVFYPHRNMQRYISAFKGFDNTIEIANWKEFDVQELLKESALLITDYSSVYFDMIYMKKPIIFYQFDEEKYREHQYQEGWFDYHNNDFGKSFSEESDVVDEIIRIVDNHYTISEAYNKQHNSLFKYFDSKNCERIFNLLKCEYK